VAKGGGAWKVAYADFVTAMMAFFLVMWITSQNQKVRESVAEYFSDPLGRSKKPSKAGSTFDVTHKGSVPRAESVDLGRGRNPHTSPAQTSSPTRRVSDWAMSNEAARAYWRRQAQRCREQAAKSDDVRARRLSTEEVATRLLARQLKEEVTKGVPAQAEGPYRALLAEALAEVNWFQVAEDLLFN
jgi:flagellar motor protein MotB